jgi:hypothetical protein
LEAEILGTVLLQLKYTYKGIKPVDLSSELLTVPISSCSFNRKPFIHSYTLKSLRDTLKSQVCWMCTSWIQEALERYLERINCSCLEITFVCKGQGCNTDERTWFMVTGVGEWNCIPWYCSVNDLIVSAYQHGYMEIFFKKTGIVSRSFTYCSLLLVLHFYFTDLTVL